MKFLNQIAKINKFKNKWLLASLTIFFIVLGIIFGLLTTLQVVYAKKILPNTYIAGIRVGGLAPPEAYKLVQKKTDNLLQKGFVFNYKNQKIIVQNSLQSLGDPDINQELVSFDLTKSIDEAALNIMTEKNHLDYLKYFYTIIKRKNVPLYFYANYDEIEEIISRDMKQIISRAKPVGIEIDNDNFSITPDISGKNIDWIKIFGIFDAQLKNLISVEIPLTLKLENAAISYDQAKKNTNKIQEIINKRPNIKLTHKGYYWTISWPEINRWLIFKKNNQDIVITLSYDELKIYLEDNILDEINTPAKDAKFEIKNGRVIKFQGSHDGKEMNLDKTINLIQNNFSNNLFENEIIVSPIQAKVNTKDINDFGIREIIGTGTSNFSGSPRNRRHNIQIGANTLNGILIKPGEEFSLVKTLGEINKENGYLTELVIKGNKTIPEYGGGLCQIGTTTFRTTFNSGLPILERRNHSYRVRYYEPAGTDATIYDPKPDFRFLNDTKNYVLIQTRIEGDELIFDFWGTKDGREIKISEPKIYNITAPPATKYIETTELAIDEKKCTESAHAGADAHFTYQVTYSDGKIDEEIFTSHYKPWGAVCLIGVEELPPENPEKNNSQVSTSTEESLD